MGQVVGRHALEHRGRGGLKIDAVGNFHELGCRHHRVFRIGTPHHRVHNAVSGFALGHAGTNRLDRPGCFDPRVTGRSALYNPVRK